MMNTGFPGPIFFFPMAMDWPVIVPYYNYSYGQNVLRNALFQGEQNNISPSGYMRKASKDSRVPLRLLSSIPQNPVYSVRIKEFFKAVFFFGRFFIIHDKFPQKILPIQPKLLSILRSAPVVFVQVKTRRVPFNILI